MPKPVIGFMTTGSEHFPYERPKELHAQAAKLLKGLDADLIVADRLVVDSASAQAAVARFHEAKADFLVSLCGAFTWDNMPVRVAQELELRPHPRYPRLRRRV